MVPCKVEINSALKLLGCPNPNDSVLLIKADGTAPLLAPYGQFLACVLPPRDIWVTVGRDGSAPLAGSSSWQHPKFANYHVELTVNRIPQFYVDGNAPPDDGTAYYTKAAASDTLFGQNGIMFNDGDKIHARMYLGQEDVSPIYIVEEDGTTQIMDETGNNAINSD